VRIERIHDQVRIEASLQLIAHHHIVWQVLTDYESLPSLVPGMRSSRRVSRPGEPLLPRQTGRSGLRLLEVVLRVIETPREAIGFSSVAGTFRSKSGEWRIESLEAGTMLTYRASIVPGFWVPPLIGPSVIRDEVRTKLAGVAAESGAAPTAPEEA